MEHKDWFILLVVTIPIVAFIDFIVGSYDEWKHQGRHK